MKQDITHFITKLCVYVKKKPPHIKPSQQKQEKLHKLTSHTWINVLVGMRIYWLLLIFSSALYNRNL